MSDHLGRLEAVAARMPEGALVWTVQAADGRHVEIRYQDIKAVCAECRRLRADVAFFQSVFSKDISSDPGQFNAGWEAGAAREREECARVAEEYGPHMQPPGEPDLPNALSAREFERKYGQCDSLPAAIRSRGPARPPVPMERLAVDNARLRVALAALLGAFALEGDGRMVIHNGSGLLARVAAARAALEGGP